MAWGVGRCWWRWRTALCSLSDWHSRISAATEGLLQCWKYHVLERPGLRMTRQWQVPEWPGPEWPSGERGEIFCWPHCLMEVYTWGGLSGGQFWRCVCYTVARLCLHFSATVAVCPLLCLYIIYHTSCKYPSSGRSSAPACGARCSAPAAPRIVTRAVIRRRFVIVR